jgi:predicted HTH transcriptional regulator
VPIPLSTLPGHRALHEKVVAALGLCQESQRVDFKESAAWNALKGKLVKTVLAMGNLRDGGVVVVGVSERNANWEITGINAEHLGTYDVDVMLGYFGSFVSPFVEIDIVQVPHDGRDFLAIQVHELQELPLVCKRTVDGLFEGAVYVRPTGGVPQTTRVMNAQQMHDLLELAAEKMARRIQRQARAIGMVAPNMGNNAFDQELEGL